MDEQQIQQQIIQLVQAAMSGDQQATQYIQQVMQAAQQGDQQATQLAQMIQAVAQQLQGQQVQSAKFGAKLNYIRQLRGACPEGYEIEYFQNGGKPCKRCIAKQKMEEGGEVPSNPVDAFKCGRKMNKKKVKKARDGEKVTVVNTPKGKYKEYDRGEYYDYVTPTDSVSENIDGRDNEAVKRLNKSAQEFYKAKEKYGVQKENNKVSKHQEGNQLPTAQPANERYKGGQYGKITNTNPFLNYSFGYSGFPRLTDYEVIVGDDGNFIYNPSKIAKGYDYIKGDSVAIEIPRHAPQIVFETASPAYKSKNPEEFKRLRRRFDKAKSVTTEK